MVCEEFDELCSGTFDSAGDSVDELPSALLEVFGITTAGTEFPDGFTIAGMEFAGLLSVSAGFDVLFVTGSCPIIVTPPSYFIPI